MRQRMFLLFFAVLVVAAAGGGMRLEKTPGSVTATGAASISAGGFHTCSLATTGDVDCWGSNAFGRLGNGTAIDQSTPVDVVGLPDGATAISAQFFHSCARTPGGGVKCWGNNALGQLGDGTTNDRDTATDVCADADCATSLSGIAAIAAGGSHTCVLTTQGSVKCWGANGGGQLGNGTTNHNYPIDVCSDEACASTLSDISAIATGGTHSCALTTAGGVVCWGGNSNGQLGDGTAENRSFPVAVAGLDSGVVAIAAAGTHTCALLSAGSVQCWGSNEFGQLGNGTHGDGDFDTHDNDSLTPVAVCSGTIAPGVCGGTLSGIAAIDAGTSHTCALTTVGTVKCWGWNEYGQLGDGTIGDGNFSTLDNLGTTPVTVCTTPVFNDADLLSPAGLPTSCTSPLVNVTAISAGGQHTCALTTAAVPTCWGRNAIGQLGDGTTIDRPVPVDVSGIGPKPTPTPAACGDVSDDGVVNAIDAALVLQLDAGLIDVLASEGSGDVNGDLETTSVDAVLILQFTAGLIGELAGCL